MQNNLASLEWRGTAADGCLRILDQTQLPGRVVYRDCQTAADVWQAIRLLQVRGAPAIGVAAAYGVVLGLRNPDLADLQLAAAVATVADYLATARPTAVNLFHALDYMRQAARSLPPDMAAAEGRQALLLAAQRWHQDDIDLCAAIAEQGAPLISDGAGVLTYCNTGALATAGVGRGVPQDFGKGGFRRQVVLKDLSTQSRRIGDADVASLRGAVVAGPGNWQRGSRRGDQATGQSADHGCFVFQNAQGCVP